MSENENSSVTLCDAVQVEVGETGFSVCRTDHPVVGECLLEGIQDLGEAMRMVERLNQEGEEAAASCAGAHGAAALPCLTALQALAAS
ncbi:MAG: hypothetical protein HQM06_05825 [Magnetococcales bacterium]|nr:hypothetical protein [Magnetococcales bacterium]